ncbi:hypothetical protein T459_23923 [Capsicum annuum]|uniref:PPM-type phosphatase domain-containing protein n=1 Tax=Capsicum annuum TaxID=4072 RepID=A0A2G2YTP9_CAPAN|nr:hypothetical protein T459_23923 [Capsicum annuum]
MGSSLYPEDAFLIAGEESRLPIDIEDTEKHLEVFQTLKESFLKAYKFMDRELRSYTNIDYFCSGTIVVTLVKQGKNLVIGNIGDSRVMLATRGEDDSLTVVQLIVDLKPDLPVSHELCLAIAIFGIVDYVGYFKDSWLMFGTIDVLDIIMCLDVSIFGIVDV